MVFFEERPFAFRSRILAAVFKAIDDVNLLLPPENQLAKSQDTPILGPAASLDSMGFVNFLAAVEDRIEAEFSIRFSLLGADSASRREAFETTGTLAAYIDRVLSPSAEERPDAI